MVLLGVLRGGGILPEEMVKVPACSWLCGCLLFPAAVSYAQLLTAK